MKLIIAGTRKLDVSVAFIEGCLEFFNLLDKQQSFTRMDVSEIVSGAAPGIDLSGEYYADLCEIKKKRFPIEKEDWINLGKSAGPLRNKKMANYADALLLIWDGKSKGSANMKKEMIKRNKPVYEVILPNAQ